MTRQTTISRSSAWVTGPQLDRDAPSSVRFHPGLADTGIVFIRGDIAAEPQVSCSLENARLEARWTSLEQDCVWIRHTEHLLAAIAGHGIDNIRVELDSDRIPVVSAGSCADFSMAIARAGIRQQDAARRTLVLREGVYHATPLRAPGSQAGGSRPEVKRYILGVPSESFSVSYVFHVPWAHGMRTATAEYDTAVHSFTDTIAHARSYFLEEEDAQVSELLGPVRRDFISLAADSPQNLVDEVALHKVIDFMGDLMVLGQPIVGRFVAFRSGHWLHHEFATLLMTGGHLRRAVLG